MECVIAVTSRGSCGLWREGPMRRRWLQRCWQLPMVPSTVDVRRCQESGAAWGWDSRVFRSEKFIEIHETRAKSMDFDNCEPSIPSSLISNQMISPHPFARRSRRLGYFRTLFPLNPSQLLGLMQSQYAAGIFLYLKIQAQGPKNMVCKGWNC